MDANDKAIEARAANLDCTVVDTLNGIVLAKRARDKTFITWAYSIENGVAHFHWGHYDMTFKSAADDFHARAIK